VLWPNFRCGACLQIYTTFLISFVFLSTIVSIFGILVEVDLLCFTGPLLSLTHCNSYVSCVPCLICSYLLEIRLHFHVPTILLLSHVGMIMIMYKVPQFIFVQIKVIKLSLDRDRGIQEQHTFNYRK